MKNWKELEKNAYARYSNRSQVCIVRSKEGNLYPGVRIENASFPLTISSYQSALFTCLSEGDTPSELYVPEKKFPEGAAFLADAYHLKITTEEFPSDVPLRQVIVHEPTDFRQTLTELQTNSRIQESNFAVTCLLQVGNGIYITGTNVELSDWQLGLCAERVAISKAISYGYTEFKSIHITAFKGDFISPCGACRQVLVEHLPYDRVVLYHPDDTISEHTPAQLLPAFFNGDSIIS